MAQVPAELRHLAKLLDDEDEDVAINVIANLLDHEDELGDLPAVLQEDPDPLVRRRAHQLQSAMTFRRRRREFHDLLNQKAPDYVSGLICAHLLWFDKDSQTSLSQKIASFVGEALRRPLLTLEDAEYLMHRSAVVAEMETTIRPENYCIGTVLEQRSGSTALLMGLLRELLSRPDFRVVRTAGEFALADGENHLLLGQGGWRIAPAPDPKALEFWDARRLLRFIGSTLFSCAVNSDSFRYVLTVAQALSGDRGDEVLDFLPYPYCPADDDEEEEAEKQL